MAQLEIGQGLRVAGQQLVRETGVLLEVVRALLRVPPVDFPMSVERHQLAQRLRVGAGDGGHQHLALALHVARGEDVVHRRLDADVVAGEAGMAPVRQRLVHLAQHEMTLGRIGPGHGVLLADRAGVEAVVVAERFGAVVRAMLGHAALQQDGRLLGQQRLGALHGPVARRHVRAIEHVAHHEPVGRRLALVGNELQQQLVGPAHVAFERGLLHVRLLRPRGVAVGHGMHLRVEVLACRGPDGQAGHPGQGGEAGRPGDRVRPGLVHAGSSGRWCAVAGSQAPSMSRLMEWMQRSTRAASSDLRRCALSAVNLS